MGFKDTLATSAAPVFLRCALGLTFLWAGLGKCFVTDHLSPADAAILANIGVITTDQASHPAAAGRGSGFTPVLAALQVQPGRQAAGGQPASSPSGPTPPPPVTGPGSNSGASPATSGGGGLPAAPPAAASARRYSAADFPSGADVLRLHGVTLKLVKAANPAAGQMAVWPRILDQSPWPVALAYAAALTEVLCGFLALTGLLGRFAGFALAVVILNAIWLDQIGPAMQTGQTHFGFLPNYPGFDVNAWRPLMWQFTLLMAACALACTGSGALSLDRMLGTGVAGGKPPSKPKPKDEI
jgi:uncharacterized membrane protein YphA (DoxX/SURF4 family)